MKILTLMLVFRLALCFSLNKFTPGYRVVTTSTTYGPNNNPGSGGKLKRPTYNSYINYVAHICFSSRDNLDSSKIEQRIKIPRFGEQINYVARWVCSITLHLWQCFLTVYS